MASEIYFYNNIVVKIVFTKEFNLASSKSTARSGATLRIRSAFRTCFTQADGNEYWGLIASKPFFSHRINVLKDKIFHAHLSVSYRFYSARILIKLTKSKIIFFKNALSEKPINHLEIRPEATLTTRDGLQNSPK